MNCKAFRREFEELEMDDSLSMGAQAHVNACAACRTFQVERLSLGQLVKSLGTVSAPPDFDFRLRARISAAESNARPLYRARSAPGLKAIFVAASFVLLVGAAIVFKQTQPGIRSAPVVAQSPAAAVSNDQTARRSNDVSAEQHDTDRIAVAPIEVKANRTENEAGTLSQPRDRAGKLAQTKLARNANPAKTNRSPVISNDIAFGGNPPILTPLHPPTTKDANDTEAAALLRVSSQPLKVLLHDRQGATRSVSLERVVFGSQDFLERATQKRPLPSDVEGIW